MLKDLKALGKESLIYGLSTVGARLLNFLLMPFYTHCLLPAEYGVVATVFSYIAFLNILYQYGMDQAYMRHYAHREKAFSTAYSCVLVTSLAFSLALALAPGFWAQLGGIGAQRGNLVLYAAAILFLDSINVLPFADLRMAHKPFYFAGVRMASITLNVALNIIFLTRLHMGIEGVFLANLISSLFSVAAVPKRFTFTFDPELFRKLVDYSLPLLPAGLGAMAVQVIDRPILLRLSGEAAVGIYQANYRLGIFMVLLVSMFDQAWRPFFLERADKPGGPAVFARVLTYFTLALVWIGMAFSFFIGDLARLHVAGRALIHESYWSGLSIVPVVMFAYLVNGIYVNLLAPIIIAKKTKVIMLATLSGALVNLAANFILIPLFGIYGPPWAAFAAYCVMALTVYYYGRRYFPVPYELRRLGAIAVLALALGAPALAGWGSGWQWTAYRFAALAAYPFALLAAGFFLPEEKQKALSFFARFRSAPGPRPA
ncbi:MAG TPA: oligosaccharide flippase family protein [Elusimicrobiales bacterium]|nr:oligosaccharide flippase family protein [Elusimicrobiales bacterium]